MKALFDAAADTTILSLHYGQTFEKLNGKAVHRRGAGVMKLIHLSDIHLTKPGERLLGLDPLSRLDACLRDIGRYHPETEFCVISGDLAHQGEIEVSTAEQFQATAAE
ncbi:hypothetical protein FHS85_002194 [Rhodoligotrophos appendicifer]|uniref:metallophosphoesterase n=1 Tax=Rhodoligotrophos appendicifer TaxID=987056 RepID=UPI0014795EFB|nr:metallophosphoesterase [Rhodoligotrophos appendicifer]